MSLATPPGTSAYIVYIVSMLPELQSSCLQYLENEKKSLSHHSSADQNGTLFGLAGSLPAVYDHVRSALSLLRRINEAMAAPTSMSSSYAIQTPCPSVPPPPRSPNAFNALIATGVSWQGALPKSNTPRSRPRPRDDKIAKTTRRKYERRKKVQSVPHNLPGTVTTATAEAAKSNLTKSAMIDNLDSLPRVVPKISENTQEPGAKKANNLYASIILFTPNEKQTYDNCQEPSHSCGKR